ncbi:hypothetical protein BHM03_00008841 [Ensete ventricosum]|uniref:Uncharacterized protein n=1 Tax=Ensete ventricosum TaxID=4639 RepID=A0A445MCH5_ENSVE|nr:hypothetical protein BHM03_00008841 [Ensete ventricosum]
MFLASSRCHHSPQNTSKQQPKPHLKQQSTKSKTTAFNIRSTNLSATKSPFIPSTVASIAAAQRCQQRSLAAIFLCHDQQRPLAAICLARGQQRSLAAQHGQQRSLTAQCCQQQSLTASSDLSLHNAASSDLSQPEVISCGQQRFGRGQQRSLAAQVASSDLSLHHLRPTAAISAFRPHQPPAAHATAFLFCHSCTTLLPLFFPRYSGAGHTAAAFCSSRALLCLFFPLRSCAFAATASTIAACRQPPSLPAAHAVSQQPQPALLLPSSSSTIGDPYVMASVDLIGAKLEAFKTRMEDKLRALFAEFRLGRSPSPTRSQQTNSLDRKENPLEKEKQATDSSYPCIRVDFPRWECAAALHLDGSDLLPLEFEEKDTKEKPQSVARTFHASFGYAKS